MFYIDNSDTAFLIGDNTLFLYNFMSDANRRNACGQALIGR